MASISGIALTWGGDNVLTATNDIEVSTDTAYGVQRVLRRLFTNPGDYIWHLDYGAGLPAKVGKPADANAIEGIIQTQMLLEACVSPFPPPVVNVTVSPSGVVVASIQYVDAPSGQAVPLTFTVPSG